MEHPKKFVLEADSNDSEMSVVGRKGLTVPRTE